MFAGVVLLDLLSGRNNTCAAWFLLCINLALIMKKSNRFYRCMSNRVSNSSRFVRQQWKWSFQCGVRVLKCKLHFVRGEHELKPWRYENWKLRSKNILLVISSTSDFYAHHFFFKKPDIRKVGIATQHLSAVLIFLCCYFGHMGKIITHLLLR